MFCHCFGVPHRTSTHLHVFFFPKKLIVLYVPLVQNCIQTDWALKQLSIWLQIEIILHTLDSSPYVKTRVVAVCTLHLAVTSHKKKHSLATNKKKNHIHVCQVENVSLQSWRQCKDAQHCRRRLHDLKVFHVICTDLIQKKKTILFHFTTNFLVKVKFVCAKQNNSSQSC
jgi:hypothetical protein